MKTPSHSQLRTARGFTLMEIMVVIAIILVLATMVVSGVGWYKRKANENRTKVLIGSIERALEEYKADHGSLPNGDGGKGSTAEVYEALYGDLDGDGKTDPGATTYLSTLDPNLAGNKLNVEKDGGGYVIIDAWKEPLRYRHGATSQMNPDFDLWSLGPKSSETETKEHIKNW